MELKPGYKPTEVGAIPADWTARTLRNCCTKITDGTHDTPKPVRFGVPFLTAIHVKENGIDYESCLYLTEADHAVIFGRCNPEKNDVLLVNIGAGVATTALVNVDYEFSLKNVALLKPDSRLLNGSFLNYALTQRKPKIIGDLSSGGAQPFLSLTQIGGIEIAVPPTKAEQEAIAEALGDADAVIESLETLLAKKRQIKQGAMQEMLTGKKRLPGFSGEWELKCLSELADIRSGGTPSTADARFWDGDVLWCTPTDITSLNGAKYLTDSSRKISRLGLESSSAEMIPSNSIVMTSRATIGECAINRLPVSTNQGFKNFVPFEVADVEFLYYLLLMQKQEFISLCGGSTFLEIGKSQLATYQLRIPPIKAEQIAISTILRDMDTDIAALDEKLCKVRQLKQGMMQELLTGRIRLV